MAFLETPDAGAQSRRPAAPQYPPTRTVDQSDVYHGVTVADPYRWLESDTATETRGWVQAQNAVTHKYLHALPGRRKIQQRLTELFNYPRYSAPFRQGDRYFYSMNDGLQNQAVIYTQQSLDHPGTALLDPNTLSEDGTVAVSTYAVSDDGRYFAYGLSESGSDWMHFLVRDVHTGKDLPDVLKWIKFSGASWTHDNKGFFYARFPAPPDTTAMFSQSNIEQKVYYHRVGQAQEHDQVIYQRPDAPDMYMNAEVTDDGRYAVLYVAPNGSKNMLWYMDMADPQNPHVNAPVKPLIDTLEASFWFVGNDGPVFYFQTDLQAARYRVIAIDINHPEKANWRTVIAESQDVIQGVSLTGGRFVVTYLRNACSQVKFFDMNGAHTADLQLPGIGSVGGAGGRQGDTEFFYTFTSYLYPTVIYRYDMKSGASTVFRASQIKFDASHYQTEQMFCTGKDGTRVPMFVTHRKGLKMDGENPTLLYGYGGFNISLTPGFNTSIIPWLEAGGVYVVVNLRGGGEYGESWHQAGTKLNKQNVFDDFIAAAEFLCDKKLTSPRRLAMQGGSNGGLLVGAVMCQRPDLFAAALPAVGVMDMLRYQHFTIGSAWSEDYGMSVDSAEFRALYAYSPLHNLKPGVHYPATLITTGDHDDRVFPAHSFKFAARLQACQSPESPALLRIETKAGHGAGKPMNKYIQEAADELAFALYHTSR